MQNTFYLRNGTENLHSFWLVNLVSIAKTNNSSCVTLLNTLVDLEKWSMLKSSADLDLQILHVNYADEGEYNISETSDDIWSKMFR